jgi:peptidoglycan/xylan/chitin deacetylase (PgdA/CDA1 family)
LLSRRAKMISKRAAEMENVIHVNPPPAAIPNSAFARAALACVAAILMLASARASLARSARLMEGVRPAAMAAKARRASPSAGPAAGRKLIALTFDDGPKPYVLFGSSLPKGPKSASLLDLLQRERVKATFFVMGWRLAPSADKFCIQQDGGRTCRSGAQEEHSLGYEIENHTYGHGNFRLMEKRYGDAWILNDIDRCSRAIQSITGVRPRDVRPPDWTIWPALQRKIEARGYHLMSRSRSLPAALRDVDSQDYFCAGSNPIHCPKPSLYAYVLATIAQREHRGVYDHILCFHELPLTVQLLSRLIPILKQQGYQFVTLSDYFHNVGFPSAATPLP